MENYSTLCLPVYPDELQRVELERRFSAAFQIYRACVREALKRLDLCRESRAWQRARALPPGKERVQAFRNIREEKGLTENALITYCLNVRNKAPQLKNHLGQVESQDGALHAIRAIDKHLYEGAGRPRIPREEDFTSIQTGVRQGILIRGAYAAGPHEKGQPLKLQTRLAKAGRVDVPLYLRWNVALGKSKMLYLKLHPHFSGGRAERDAYYLAQLDALVATQLVRVWVKGRWCYEAHLKFKLPPYRKPLESTLTGEVCIDVGPQNLALVAAEGGAVKTAWLIRPSANERKKEMRGRKEQRRLQRAQERSRRASNPAAYQEKARLVKVRAPRKSKAYLERQARLREVSRRQGEEAVRRERELAKLVVRHGGPSVITEDLTKRPWAKLWGSSVLRFAPGRFMATIEREAQLVGGSVRKVSVWTTALSSTCICGTRKRKPLEVRQHVCDTCGLGSQSRIDRDLFSAFLGLYLEPSEDKLDASRAASAWAGAERLLAVAASHPIGKLTGDLMRQQKPKTSSAKAASSQKLEQHNYPQDDVAVRRGLGDAVQDARADLFTLRRE